MFSSGAAALTAIPATARAAKPELRIGTPMAPPRWALLQRELIDMQVAAAQTFHDRYFDKRHYLQAFERWGANDGPDDAIEHVNDWPLLHTIGGSGEVLRLTRAVQEGHFEQYSRLRTTDVPMGRQGMLVRDFPPQMDWQHIGEELTTFNLLGLSSPRDQRLIARTRRFADFYTGRDPIALNYDPQRKLIRSMFNGSIGPLMRPATALDWAGDPFDPAPFRLEHGETTYQQFLDHYREYTDVVGDHPLNLNATTLALNAWMLTGEDRFKVWLLEYVEAWLARTEANGGIIPSNVGLDGVIGSAAGGKWYGGTYGWGFSPVVPQTGLREDRNRVPRAMIGFMNAYLISGDDRYLAMWRRQNARINEAGRIEGGVFSAPTMHGDAGWYSFKPGQYRQNNTEIWYQSMRSEDRAAMASEPWLEFLTGRNPGWAEQALAADIARVREKLAEVTGDTSTRETRLADNALEKNPISVTALLHQTLGALHVAHRGAMGPTSPRQGGAPLFARLRHFDGAKRKSGLPDGVAVLVEGMDAASTTAVVVNCDPHLPKTMVVRGGGYGEHAIRSVRIGEHSQTVGGRDLKLRLAPGAGARLVLDMACYSLKPILDPPDW